MKKSLKKVVAMIAGVSVLMSTLPVQAAGDTAVGAIPVLSDMIDLYEVVRDKGITNIGEPPVEEEPPKLDDIIVLEEPTLHYGSWIYLNEGDVYYESAAGFGSGKTGVARNSYTTGIVRVNGFAHLNTNGRVLQSEGVSPDKVVIGASAPDYVGVGGDPLVWISFYSEDFPNTIGWISSMKVVEAGPAFADAFSDVAQSLPSAVWMDPYGNIHYSDDPRPMTSALESDCYYYNPEPLPAAVWIDEYGVEHYSDEGTSVTTNIKCNPSQEPFGSVGGGRNIDD